jgi:hypothetical protein
LIVWKGGTGERFGGGRCYPCERYNPKHFVEVSERSLVVAPTVGAAIHDLDDVFDELPE